jgi:hypothetical protein
MKSTVGTSRPLVASLAHGLPRVLLVVLFYFAAIDKCVHFPQFVAALQSYHILPAEIGRYAAIFIILVELAIASGLLTRWRRLASLSAILLLATFTIIYLAAHPQGACGCWFTLTLAKGGTLHILQNLAFIGLAILIWLDDQRPSTRVVRVSGLYSSAKGADGGELGSISG